MLVRPTIEVRQTRMAAFQYKDCLPRYGDSHFKVKIVGKSYLFCNGNPSGKTVSLNRNDLLFYCILTNMVFKIFNPENLMNTL